MAIVAKFLALRCRLPRVLNDIVAVDAALAIICIPGLHRRLDIQVQIVVIPAAAGPICTRLELTVFSLITPAAAVIHSILESHAITTVVAKFLTLKYRFPGVLNNIVAVHAALLVILVRGLRQVPVVLRRPNPQIQVIVPPVATSPVRARLELA